MRIRDTDQALLAALQFDGRAELTTIAKRLKTPVHSLHYSLRRLEQAGIVRRGLIVNYRLLGYEQFEILFSMNPESQRAKQDLLKALRSHPLVIWIAELGGDYQYGISLCAESVSHASELIEGIAKKHGNIFSKKTVAGIVSLAYFRKKYLAARGTVLAPAALTVGKAEVNSVVDETDIRILASLFKGQHASDQALARQAGIPRTTVAFRLKRLEEKGVILRHIYFISAAKLGMMNFKLLVAARGVQPSLSVTLYRFAAEAKSITMFIHCLGSWDYELVVEVREHAEVIAVVEELTHRFSEEIYDIKVLSVFGQTTSNGFLQFK